MEDEIENWDDDDLDIGGDDFTFRSASLVTTASSSHPSHPGYQPSGNAQYRPAY